MITTSYFIVMAIFVLIGIFMLSIDAFDNETIVENQEELCAKVGIDPDTGTLRRWCAVVYMVIGIIPIINIIALIALLGHMLYGYILKRSSP